ncbi:MAG TPA: MFS transporter [Candidatus Avipropionibacterium avicola]|uniref:MFS transporter n=1 Tax=Candidatus Avipropionibacterium avicola TaxID=2840701 RepID=A0A9D1H0Y7_9ACTN|nr:MFS transporter [Candidatus Avipropionibacterium avicola]
MTTTASCPPETGAATPQPSTRLPYAALLTMMTMSFLLVSSEFMPNGVLTEMAAGLGVTPGQAGQTVTVTALVGLVVAPTIGLAFPRLDRRSLLIWLALAAAVSNLVVAVAPNLPLVLLARFLLGAALSGFWSMSVAVAAAVAGPARLGRAVTFTSAGVSLATVAGVPLGVLLSEVLDWRTAFAVIGIVTGLVAIGLRTLLPSVPAADVSSLRLLVDTLRRPRVGAGLAGHVLVVLGHALAYTYVRLALERSPQVEASQIVVLLAIFGAGGLIGNAVFGMIVDRRYAVLSVTAPIVIAAMLAGVILLDGSLLAIGVVVFVWGGFFASWLIVVNTWVGHRMPDRLEAGGSLVVVGFQGAISLAGAGGGLLVDLVGVEAVYGVAAVALLAGAVLFGRAQRRPESTQAAVATRQDEGVRPV